MENHENPTELGLFKQVIDVSRSYPYQTARKNMCRDMALNQMGRRKAGELQQFEDPFMAAVQSLAQHTTFHWANHGHSAQPIIQSLEMVMTSGHIIDGSCFPYGFQLPLLALPVVEFLPNIG